MMTPPATADDFLTLLRRSELIEPERLDAYLEQAPPSLPAMPVALARALIGAGMLTRFHAEQLLRGKWRGFILGKYRLLQLLGSGGMGRVFLGEHVHLHRLAALKIPPTAPIQEPGIVGRFYREACAAAALDHPNVVRVYDVDHDGKHHFLVLEFVDGTSLHRLVAEHGPLPVARACHYIAQAAAGLGHAHQAGWIHRDIKPSNILVDRHGTVKILDLGLARFLPEDRDGLTGKHDRGVILGSADFVAPEQVDDSSQALDPRADLYSLGATFYYLLTGMPPFGSGNLMQKLLWHKLRDPTPVRELRPDVPARLSAIVSRMLAKGRAQRFQTAAKVVAALASWTAPAIDPPPSEEMPRYCPLVCNLIKAWRRPG
jgi:serine/threonine protein kinase